ncbi:MAG: tyrosine-type recombinase/integrase [Xanthomonadaceae bacterium]|nr:tyrosine-type recombinase/integrase [Xanthomonadaceae bacterium]
MSQTFGRAVHSFIGHLQGTSRSQQTIASYKSDLNQLSLYLKKRFPKDYEQLSKLTPAVLGEFMIAMDQAKEKTNTKRRKLLTIQKFLRYLSSRKKISTVLSNRIPTPHKIEKSPQMFELKSVLTAIEKLPADSHLLSRNKLILWMLAETGCQVSELCGLTFDDFTNGERPNVVITGKSARNIPISQELRIAVFEHRQFSAGSHYLFRGFSRAGALPGKISDRAIELVVKSYRAELGEKNLTPRAFRRTIVMQWFEQGLTQAEIKSRLGLKSDYAFKLYEPLLKQNHKKQNKV